MYIILIILSWDKYGLFLSYDQTKEVLIPYLINHGNLLYKDIAYFYGPLTPYILAFLTRVFGFKLTIFYVFGLTIIFIYCLCLYHLSRLLLDKIYSTVVVLLFLVQIAFNNHGAFILPYTYSALVGSLLVVLMAIFIIHHLKTFNNKYLYFASIVIFFCSLVKQDFFLVCLLIITLYFLLLPVLSGNSKKIDNKNIVITYIQNIQYKLMLKVFIITLVPVVIIYIIIGYISGFNNLLYFLIPFKMYFSGPSSFFISHVNKASLSFNTLLSLIISSLIAIIVITSIVLLIYFIIYLFNSYKGSHKSYFYLLIGFIILLFILPLYNDMSLISFIMKYSVLKSRYIYQGINLWLLIYLICLLLNIKQHNNNILILVIIAALIVSMRTVLNMSLFSFPLFYLSLHLIIFVYLVVHVYPVIIKKWKVYSEHNWLVASRMFLMIIVLFYAFVTLAIFNKSSICIQSYFGRHYLLNSDQKAINKTLEHVSTYIQKNSSKSDKILAYPTSVIVYLYSQRLPASKHFNLFPTTVYNHQEELNIIKEIKENHPKFILISNNDFYSTYNIGKFGSKDNLPQLYNWITSNYRKIKQFSSCKDHWFVVDVYSK